MSTAPTYLLYTNQVLPHHYLAIGTDGYLYMVPMIPGGWRERYPCYTRYKLTHVGTLANLEMTRLGGQVGEVHIASLDDDLWLPISEAATTTDINANTLKTACQQGRIAARPFGTEWAIRTAALKDFAANHRRRRGEQL